MRSSFQNECKLLTSAPACLDETVSDNIYDPVIIPPLQAQTHVAACRTFSHHTHTHTHTRTSQLKDIYHIQCVFMCLFAHVTLE